PSDVSPRVLSALARPTIGHLDPEFQALMEETKTALQRLFNAPDHACVPLPAPGTAGMEAAIMNLLEPGDRCVVAVNGAFGGRMADMAGRGGGAGGPGGRAGGRPGRARRPGFSLPPTPGPRRARGAARGASAPSPARMAPCEWGRALP